jgi:hypothetical protein
VTGLETRRFRRCYFQRKLTSESLKIQLEVAPTLSRYQETGDSGTTASDLRRESPSWANLNMANPKLHEVDGVPGTQSRQENVVSENTSLFKELDLIRVLAMPEAFRLRDRHVALGLESADPSGFHQKPDRR